MLPAGQPENDQYKNVPPLFEHRDKIRQLARTWAEDLAKSETFTHSTLRRQANTLLEQCGLPEDYVGWTMVILGSEAWRKQVQSVPYSKRLLLLPHCLRDATKCPAKYDATGLLCEDCGRCVLTKLRAAAREKGYRVIIAEGSPVVMQLILSGQADAVLGVGCLLSLEKAFDKLQWLGMPAMAVPLFASTCRNTKTDLDWVEEMIDTPYRPEVNRPSRRIQLVRFAASMFQPGKVEMLLPRKRTASEPVGEKSGGHRSVPLDPIAVTEDLAYDFLTRGGKFLRPYITLAAYDALRKTSPKPPASFEAEDIPVGVQRVAMAIELFHKASLVHDDIEDDDAYRYGHKTLHRMHGVPTAINVGDYLIGLGYRLIVQQRKEEVGTEKVADILDHLARAHTRLCEGQGAELAWRGQEDKQITTLEALKIYALKTSPAFEAALYAGLRLGTDTGNSEAISHMLPEKELASFARHLGIAYQIHNDLEDWSFDAANKKQIGGDLLAGRPTVLWALALEKLSPTSRQELIVLQSESLESSSETEPGDGTSPMFERARELYQEAGVFDHSLRLAEKHAHRARHIAREAPSDSVRDLFLHFLEAILPSSPASPSILS